MNTLIEAGHIKEMVAGTNFSYVLSDNNNFLSTEYKVLQSQAEGCFVKCMKMLYNGKIQLFYNVQSLTPFSTLLPTIDAEGLLTIISNLFADIIDVKHNGFLSCQNIDISFDKIYIDSSTYKVSLVYLPVNTRLYDSVSIFENELRTALVKLISGISTFSSPKLVQLMADLSDGTLSIEDLYSRIKGGTRTSTTNAYMKQNGVVGNLRIVAMNAPTRVEIAITKNEFVIGKKAEVCDGVVDFNKMISRVHCKICKNGSQYTITDLQSANGTFLNKMRLQPNQPFPIKSGDVIRLANSDFQVNMG